MKNKQFLKKNKWILEHWNQLCDAQTRLCRETAVIEHQLRIKAQKKGFNNAFFTYADDGIFGIQIGGEYGDSKSGILIHDAELRNKMNDLTILRRKRRCTRKSVR